MKAHFSFTFTVHPEPPFAWDVILDSLRRSPGTVLERITEWSYARALILDGQPAVIRVTGLGAPEVPELTATVTASAATQDLEAAANAAVRRIFQTEVETQAIDGIVDPVLQKYWQPRRGFRPVQLPTVWEAITWAIIGQQINVAFAAKCKAALCERYGARYTAGGGEFTLYPTPEALVPLQEADLQALQFSRQKARYVLGLARAIVEGRFDVEALRGVTALEALERLMALKGIGRWTAEYVLMRGLGYPDALPAGDVALQRAVGRAYGLSRLATEAEVRAYGERWAPFRSYATIAFWSSNATATAVGRAAAAAP